MDTSEVRNGVRQNDFIGDLMLRAGAPYSLKQVKQSKPLSLTFLSPLHDARRSFALLFFAPNSVSRVKGVFLVHMILLQTKTWICHGVLKT